MGGGGGGGELSFSPDTGGFNRVMGNEQTIANFIRCPLVLWELVGGV